MVVQQQEQQDMSKMIRIDNDVHAELGELGKKNESYNDVVRRLIEHYKKGIKK
jgi:predicted CopG family antitoxin